MVKTQPSNAGSVGSTPGQEAKIPHATGCRGKKKKNFTIPIQKIMFLKRMLFISCCILVT